MAPPNAKYDFSECSAFYRDTSLPNQILALYQVGLLFREPTFCDATFKFGGFAAPHRYLIISSNARCIDELSLHPEWGLCLWQTGRIFKVIGVHESNKHTQITLLEVPDEVRQEFTSKNLTEMEILFAHQAEEQFKAALQLPALPEHQTRIWLDRLEFPLGVNENGQFLEFWKSEDE